MDLNVYLIGGVVIVLAIIILNHQRQKNKMQNFLNESGGTQPIFLQKSVEKKIKALSDMLYDGGIKPLTAAMPGLDNGPKQKLVLQLERLEKEYAGKKIALRAYDEQLFDLLEKAKKLPVTA